MTLLHDVGISDTRCAGTVAVNADGAASTRLNAAILSLAAGGAVVLCDDVECPTRGELVFAAAQSTAALVAFAVRHGSGFLQVALPGPRCDQLGLIPQCGADRAGLQQCVTVDAKAAIGTGISAHDRSTTIQLLASPDAVADSFTRPGHVVPLRAAMDRPLQDFGLTEAAVWMATAAGAGSAAVLTTLIAGADTTGIACGQSILSFSQDHGLPLVGTRDLVDSAPVSMTLDQQLYLSSETARLLVFDDHDAKWLCLLLGDVVGRSDIPLQLVTANGIFENFTAQQRGPRIRLARGNGHPRPSERYLQRRLLDPHSAIRRAFQHAGVGSVSLNPRQRPVSLTPAF
jgi:3,4-dihydroxy-2-butanone 4-phosphate synthase